MQVTVRIPDHALEFAESMERLHLMLWLLPAKDLKEIVDYLSIKGLKFDQSLVRLKPVLQAMKQFGGAWLSSLA